MLMVSTKHYASLSLPHSCIVPYHLTSPSSHTTLYTLPIIILLLQFGLSSLLRRSSPARIVNVASNYAGDLDLNDLQFQTRKYDVTEAYKQSKQADRMLSWAGAELLNNGGITVNACHPGVTTSTVLKGLGYEEGWDTPSASAKTAVFLASGR